MTSITAEHLIDQRRRWLSRRSIAAFVAGVVLATAATLGITAATGGSGTSLSPHDHVPTDVRCLVLRGPC